MSWFVGDIEEATLTNTNYRAVLHTGPDSQLVVMSLLPGEAIGEESHAIDQFIRIEAGEGEAMLGGRAYPISDGYAVVIPAGLSHDIRNTGKGALKLYTIYSAPEHPHGAVHATKADSIAAEGH